MSQLTDLSAFEWLTPEETATLLRVNKKLIYTLARTDPTFPAVKLTNKIRIRRSRLDRWLDQRHPARPARRERGLPKPLGSAAQVTAAPEER